jgi:hypothetical protein
MYKQQLILESLFIEYDDTTFRIKANNENCAASLIFYGTPDEFAKFGAELIDFPKNINQEVHYPPQGAYSEDVLYVYFLTIKAFCYDPNGHAALKITIDTHGSLSDHYQAAFFIKTDVATLNRFGQKLAGWDVKRVSKIFLYDEE